MAEKSENEASTTGQDVETPETEQDSATAGQVGTYRESEAHVPDPTALTGTLETTGTGGGVHERITGTTRIFGDSERIIQQVETLINERTSSLKEEVRGLLLQTEATTQASQIPQQSVEEHGLPTHQGNIVAPHNDTGAAQDAPRSANVGAGSPDDVSAGAEPVADPAEGDSYSQQNIAGARNPQEPVDKAQRAQSETSEDKGLGTAIGNAAKKTAARRQTANKQQQNKK